MTKKLSMVLVAGMLAACAGHTDHGAGGDGQLALAPGLWQGDGADSCGRDWSLDLATALDGSVSGSLVRGGVDYSIHGDMDARGRIAKARAGRDPGSFGQVGPYFLTLDMTVTPTRAKGGFLVEEAGTTACATRVELDRVE